MKNLEPNRLVIIVAIVLLVVSAIFFVLGLLEGDGRDFYANLATEFLSIAITVIVIDRLYWWRDRKHEQRLNERLAEERKREIIERMGSRVHGVALEAVRLARREGWIGDGSLEGFFLSHADLEGAYLSGANLEGAYLASTNLKEADLFRVNLKDSALGGANLEGVHLSGANLEGAYLHGANLEGAHLQGANLERACLGEAILKSAVLWGGYFAYASSEPTYGKHEGANLSGADLRGCNLQDAKLTGRSFTYAEIGHSDNAKIGNSDDANLLEFFVNLEDTSTSGANLKNAIFDNQTVWPDDFDYKTAGALNWDEMSEDERKQWRAKYPAGALNWNEMSADERKQWEEMSRLIP